jgi:hypothetical protein
MAWFSVRHFIQNGSNYEERITVWDRLTDDDAIDAAFIEATSYCESLHDAQVIDFFQTYELFESPGDGQEVFSLIRASVLAPDDYLDRYFRSPPNSA